MKWCKSDTPEILENGRGESAFQSTAHLQIQIAQDAVATETVNPVVGVLSTRGALVIHGALDVDGDVGPHNVSPEALVPMGIYDNRSGQ